MNVVCRKLKEVLSDDNNACFENSFIFITLGVVRKECTNYRTSSYFTSRIIFNRFNE